jgi:ADP-ribose pyrophosphatase
MSRRSVYRGRIVDLGLETATLPDGRTVELEVVRHPGAAAVVPLHDDGTVTLVHQYRHAGGGMHHEVPAGLLEPGESPAVCAARELAEEVQLQGTLESLGVIYTTPGFTDERIHIFRATGLSAAPGELDPDEYIRVVRVPVDEALGMVRDGRLTDAKTICALHLALCGLPQRSDMDVVKSLTGD